MTSWWKKSRTTRLKACPVNHEASSSQVLSSEWRTYSLFPCLQVDCALWISLGLPSSRNVINTKLLVEALWTLGQPRSWKCCRICCPDFGNHFLRCGDEKPACWCSILETLLSTWIVVEGTIFGVHLSGPLVKTCWDLWVSQRTSYSNTLQRKNRSKPVTMRFEHLTDHWRRSLAAHRMAEDEELDDSAGWVLNIQRTDGAG